MTPPYDLSPMYARMDPQLQSSQVSSTVLDSPISLYNQWNYPSPDVIQNAWSPTKKFERIDWRMTPSPMIRDATPVETKFDWESPSVQTDLIMKTDPDSTTLTPGRITTPDVKTPASPLGNKFTPWDESVLVKGDDLSDAVNLSKVIEEKSLSASQQSLDDKIVLSPSTLAPPSPFSPPSPNAPTNLLPTSIPLNLEHSTATFSNKEELSLPNTQNLPRPCANNESQTKTSFEESFLKPQTPPPVKPEKCCQKISPETESLLDHVKLEIPQRDDFKMENLNSTNEQWSQYGTDALKQEFSPSWLNSSCSAASLLDIPPHLNLPYSGPDNKNWQQQSVYPSNAKNYLRLNPGSPQLGYQVRYFIY